MSVLNKKLIVIGAGMSGTKFAVELAQRCSNYEITLFNEEPLAGYNRIMLSPVLAGEKQFTDIILHDEQWYAQHNITVKAGEAVTSINGDCQTVSTSKGEYAYDQLVIATGSNPFIIPIANNDAQGVLSFRTKADVDAMLAYAHSKDKNKCVVIGGGLLGLEAASALAQQGADVFVVHTQSYILNRQLSEIPASLLRNKFEAQGIRFYMNASSEKILVDENNQVTGLQFKDSTSIEADLIVMAVGVRPNIELAKNSGVHCEKGILVNEYMHTNYENIYALGECVQFEEQLFGLVAPTYAQAEVLVQQLSGEGDSEFAVQPSATKLKVSGINLFSAGDIEDKKEYEFIEYQDLDNATYKRLSIKDEQIIGVVMYGDVLDGSWFFDLMMAGENISAMRQQLIFGQAVCEKF